MEKSLDRKLAAIHADPSGCREFIIADAKDADMAFGVGAPGKSPEMHTHENAFRTLADYRGQIRRIVQQGLVDIMLMSSSTNDVLTIQERLFENSHITPAARANDTSDIFVVRGGEYIANPSVPFRTALLDHIQCGHVDCRPEERIRGANLGLYSITFNNRLEEDLAALKAYNRFREEAERKGFRHFLELFDPNAPYNLTPEQIPRFINDCIARTLAGVASSGRPIFLKIVYHGPQAMEELVSYDPNLVIGILGGGAGTTYDAFKLIGESQKYGARVALFGRKINNAECQLAFVQFLRLIVEKEISPEEAVRAYHGVLQKLNIRPQRSLEDDLQLQTGVMSYGGRSSSVLVTNHPLQGTAAPPKNASDHHHDHSADDNGAGHQCPCGGPSPEKCTCTGPASESGNAHAHPTPAAVTPAKTPDFAKMSAKEKLAYNQAKRDRIYGKY